MTYYISNSQRMYCGQRSGRTWLLGFWLTCCSAIAQPDTFTQADSITSKKVTSSSLDLEPLVDTDPVEQVEVVVQGERIGKRTYDLGEFILDSLRLESKIGPPERFLSNVARLIRLGVVQSSQVIELQAEAAKRSTNRATKQQVISILEGSLLSAENGAFKHRLLGDLYLQLAQFGSAIENYDQALRLTTSPSEAHFIEDSKSKAIILMKVKSKP